MNTPPDNHKKSNMLTMFAFAIPVILACIVGYGIQNNVSITGLFPVLLIAALALFVAYYFLRRGLNNK